MLALGIKIIRNAETEIRNAEVEKVFGKAGLSPTVVARIFTISRKLRNVHTYTYISFQPFLPAISP
jgi:hypothetical protein